MDYSTPETAQLSVDMVTIAEISGLIAAAVIIGMCKPLSNSFECAFSGLHLLTFAVQYTLPAALVVILVKYIGTVNSAVTWYVY